MELEDYIPSEEKKQNSHTHTDNSSDVTFAEGYWSYGKFQKNPYPLGSAEHNGWASGRRHRYEEMKKRYG